VNARNAARNPHLSAAATRFAVILATIPAVTVTDINRTDCHTQPFICESPTVAKIRV